MTSKKPPVPFKCIQPVVTLFSQDAKGNLTVNCVNVHPWLSQSLVSPGDTLDIDWWANIWCLAECGRREETFMCVGKLHMLM